VEIVLAIGLLCVLATVGVLSVPGLRRAGDLREGVSRFETVLRMARADAANLGRRVRLSFSPEGATRVLWEPQPLRQPGQFVPYVSCTWLGMLPEDLVRVRGCVLTDESASGAEAGIGLGEVEEPSGVTFYPDGSSDSAVIDLAPPAGPQAGLGVLELDGLNQTIRARILTAAEYEEEFGRSPS